MEHKQTETTPNSRCIIEVERRWPADMARTSCSTYRSYISCHFYSLGRPSLSPVSFYFRYSRSRPSGISRFGVRMNSVYANPFGRLLIPDHRCWCRRPGFETDRLGRLHPNPFGLLSFLSPSLPSVQLRLFFACHCGIDCWLFVTFVVFLVLSNLLVAVFSRSIVHPSSLCII
jgi:hypothetical protein